MNWKVQIYGDMTIILVRDGKEKTGLILNIRPVFCCRQQGFSKLKKQFWLLYWVSDT